MFPALLFAFVKDVAAQQLIAYPARGQSTDER